MKTIKWNDGSDRPSWKRHLGRAGAAAVLACAACCAAPLLAAAAGSGAAASVAAWVTPGSELLVGGLVFVVALVVMAIRGRRKSEPRCGSVCSADGSCCGGEPADTASVPIACTLGVGDRADRAAEFRKVFRSLVATETTPSGFRWRFSAEPGLEQQLVDLARREHDCCRFFQFQVFSVRDEIIWEVRADERAAAVVDELMRLPETLSATSGPDALERALSSTGLTFTSDRDEAAAP